MRKNAAAHSPATPPTTNRQTIDVVKISVKPTSENHHQSVTRDRMVENETRRIKNIPKNVKEKNLVMLTAMSDILCIP